MEPKETMVETICKEIRRDIIAHELIPGQKINVKELAKRYGASETPVKQALNQLAAEQIVENFPRHGMKIKSIDSEEAREIFQLRLMMDTWYTKEIIEAVRINKELRDALEKNVEEHFQIMSRYEKDRSVENYIEYYLQDDRFHELYLICSGNRKMVELYHSINPFIYSNYIFRKQSVEKNYAGLEEHKQIIQAIFDEDEERLKKCLKTHIDNALQAFEIIIKTDKML
ncbi:MAG: GntR family transcriptional regulator [Firmicutes bacterium]|nr:GntR family transcriptional regulator [Bacillota bacterium]MDD7602115.1 GntR family transcriptional regulator [Bacillota bacterium]MDY5856958.1 GntR family transcriptional regulator [Anaerovoracaceae bacterium]